MFLSEFMENMKLILRAWRQILEGTATTLFLAIVGTFLGFILALGLAFLRIQEKKSKDKLQIRILKTIGIIFSKVYITVFRGTPLIVQAVIFFYGFAMLGLVWSPLQAGLFTVALNTTAYLGEILRSAIQNLDKGQYEASRALGLNSVQSMLFVVFPQAVKNSMAAIGNEVIVNIKDTAVLSVIMIMDLYNVARGFNSQTASFVEGMLVAGVIYLILTYSSSKLIAFLEKKLGVESKIVNSSSTVEV